MGTIICPNCKADFFVWSIDEEVSPNTQWGCYHCKYQAFEDEKLERICAACNKKSELHLEDEACIYWWCHLCCRKTIIVEK